jgi:hypothetical protein
MALTQAQCQSQLDAWLAASAACALNQSYEIGTRKLTRADAAEIQSMIKYWQNELIKAETGRRGSMRVSFGVMP